MTSVWRFIRINFVPSSFTLFNNRLQPPCLLLPSVYRVFCTSDILRSSSSPLIPVTPYFILCAHTQNTPQTISFFCQLHMRGCHGLHPPSVAAKYFPISFMCHCSFPSTTGCISQLENWFIMLSSPELGEGWGRNNVDRVSGNRCWSSQRCGSNESLYAIGQIWLGQFSSLAVLDLREERFRAVIGFGITMATTE